MKLGWGSITWDNREFGDTITFHYGFLGLFHHMWYSKKLETFFSTKKELLTALANYEKIGKITSYSVEDLVLSMIRKNLNKGTYLVLLDITPTTKASTFWRSLSVEDAKHFSKEVVILKPKDYSEAKRLCENITTDFATAFVFKDGELKHMNGEF